ncbi:MAG: pilus assembly protein [Micavibrio aeruginosavorus]|uniref:Pilus assembly protein n=1 Tax=Micavibrio aeruginosavorus TaxID=349221 RepID=A0A7T5UI04_9BACT|nr:MAG: pilus assembly protein [Micavibrio aeruginosavorus]
MKKNVLGKFSSFFALLSEGSIAVAFGLLAPVLIGAVGISMDVSQAYLVRQRLHGALDASVLAAAASNTDEEGIENRVIEFLESNYPPDKIGNLDFDNVSVEVTDSEVTVTAVALFPTTFTRIFGVTSISVSSSTTVAREIRGLEVVLVLDNTGSLGSTNMAAVKTAAQNFVDILFDRVEEADDVRIGIVPYAASVRVGRYGLGQFPDGSSGYGTPFVTLPSGVSYTTSHSGSGWYGCVVDHKETDYNDAATHVANTRGQLWTTSGTGLCTGASNCRGHGWRPDSTTNDPYPDDTADDYPGPWDIYVSGRVISSGQECDDYSGYSNSRCSSCTGSGGDCNKTYCYCWRSQPNESCPYANILPLSSDQAALTSTINSMTYHGNTYSNIGMAWGMRVLSPDEPFIEGSEWDDEEWNKAIVLMTDGEMYPSSIYSSYWSSSRSTTVNNVTEMNERLLEVCDWLKDDPRNVIIYTITFDHTTSDITEDTKEIYRQCATDSDHYFDAPSQAELITTFEQISGALANLHLKQ